jgi:hypothetical protein
MPQLAVVMIFLAAMICLVLLSWAAYDNREKREQPQSGEPEEPGELQTIRAAA